MKHCITKVYSRTIVMTEIEYVRMLLFRNRTMIMVFTIIILIKSASIYLHLLPYITSLLRHRLYLSFEIQNPGNTCCPLLQLFTSIDLDVYKSICPALYNKQTISLMTLLFLHISMKQYLIIPVTITCATLLIAVDNISTVCEIAIRIVLL